MVLLALIAGCTHYLSDVRSASYFASVPAHWEIAGNASEIDRVFGSKATMFFGYVIPILRCRPTRFLFFAVRLRSNTRPARSATCVVFCTGTTTESLARDR